MLPYFRVSERDFAMVSLPAPGKPLRRKMQGGIVCIWGFSLQLLEDIIGWIS
jgi:hypothetical protein